MGDLSKENLRLNRMTKFVFTCTHLTELRNAILDLFELFDDILTNPINTYSDLMDRVNRVREGRLANVRSKYLLNDEAGYHEGKFTDNETVSVVKILLDFVAMMDNCVAAIVGKVEDYNEGTSLLEGKIRSLEDRLKTTEQLLENSHVVHKERHAEITALVDRNQQLLKQIAEKNERIRLLEKSERVSRWEEEKKILLKQSAARIDELEKEVEHLKRSLDLHKNIASTTDTSYKAMKLKNQLMTEKGNSEDQTHNLTRELGQQNFMQDKDIMYLEKQLYDLQTSTVGVLGGMKTDFHQLTKKFIDPSDGHIDEEFVKLSSRMDKVHKAIAENSIDTVKQVLPPHYKFTDDENIKVKRIRRLSMPAKIPPRVPSHLDNRKPVLSPIPSSGEHTPIETRDLHDIPESKNPVLIDPSTKRLHSINPLKYFPFMSPAFIKDQYERFKEYDENGDGSLDLEEMVHCVKKLGFQFNVHELQEAMEEVDRDGNNSLDFFEYMLIIDGIYRRNGQAAVFKEGFTEVKKKNMSKTCSIQ
ncbi:uncharacterized protein LOC127835534 [Dreissena polymorpha]|nr:uncharacterized protein LOC127835534 [Dreissena polymorpha]